MRRRLAHVAVLALLASLPVLVAADRQSFPRASPDIELLVKQALEDRFAAGNVPDRNLLGASRRIAIREDMAQARLTLGSAALPQQEGYEFYLLSTTAAQAEADRTGQHVHFVLVDGPAISADLGVVWIGVDFVAPRDRKMIKLCCCSGRGQFRRIDGRWTFVKWLETVCSSPSEH